jgi:FMN phosphatase YigB (HAD superfamily)
VLKGAILKSFDALELACRYCWLGELDRVVSEFHSEFKKLVLVTHNGSRLWERLRKENHWPNLFDVVLTRNDMSFFKPDPRACGRVLEEFAQVADGGECWVIGNSKADRELGINLRRKYANLVVRTVRVDRTRAGEMQRLTHLDTDVNSVNGLLRLMRRDWQGDGLTD